MNRSKKNYDAFISYKHDPYISRVAHAVLRKLEHYRPPGVPAPKRGNCIFASMTKILQLPVY